MSNKVKPDEELLDINGTTTGNLATTRTERRKRKKPFEAEWALLKELGLA
jgi:hypothetical protein